MLQTYGLNVNEDNEDTYSKFMCVRCFALINSIRRMRSVTITYRAKQGFVVRLQTNHSRTCILCSHLNSLMYGCVERNATRPGPTTSHSASVTDLTTEISSPHFDNEDNSSQDKKKPYSFIIAHTLATTETHGTNTCNTDLRNPDSSHSDRTNTTYTALHQTDNATDTNFSTNITCTANQVHDSICNPLISPNDTINIY
ncbi:hypothetical protein PoB_001910500 [Plakobranchus ocellatus]|uniref:Uncharacterized protein n=1 Tax=Plakobranchus ocellatus TaxID=259542 RepID=A0AAV3ZAP2_9GAST|nr:hypothetical protein PoB_001910500 [Plakobranchus ocellatus]